MTYWYIVVKTIELKLFMYCKHKIYFILTLRRVLHAKFFINVDEKYCHFSIDALPIIMSIGSYRNWRKSDLALYLFKSYHKHNMLLGTNFWYHEIIAHNIYSHMSRLFQCKIINLITSIGKQNIIVIIFLSLLFSVIICYFWFSLCNG